MVRIASYNVENLFARAKALNGDTWDEGEPILKAHHDVNELFDGLARQLSELIQEGVYGE